jgi:hypothetical protein
MEVSIDLASGWQIIQSKHNHWLQRLSQSLLMELAALARAIDGEREGAEELVDDIQGVQRLEFAF